MGNLSEAPSEELVRCECCLRGAEEHDLYESGEDRICERCQALFKAAKVLSEKVDADEVDIISTLALAAHCGWDVPEDYSRKYRRFEAKGVLKGVPMLRLKPMAADVVTYPRSRLVRHVRIEIFSKFTRPEHIAEHYQEILASEGLTVWKSSPGSIRWEYLPTAEAQGEPDCKDYNSQAEAQADLRSDPSNPFGLDRPPGEAFEGTSGVAGIWAFAQLLRETCILGSATPV